MFKNNSNKENNNYISKEEVEKIYEHQKKLFNAKIEEQQEKINELINYISAKFGDDFANSNITKQIKQLENNLQTIESRYKSNTEENLAVLKKEIENESVKFFIEFNKKNKEQSEIYSKYSKFLEKNEKDIANVKDILTRNNNQVLDLSKFFQEYIKGETLYKKEIQEEFENTNKKIGKINYLGITGKFDKKLKDESKKIEDKIEETKNLINGNIVHIEKESYRNNEELSGKITKLNEDMQKNETEINALNEKLLEGTININKEIKNNKTAVISLEEKLNGKITKLNEDVQKNEIEINALNEKLLEGTININKEIKNNKTTLISLEENLNGKIEKIKQESKTAINEIEENINNNQEQLSDNIIKLSEDIQNNESAINELNEKLVSENDDINKTIQNNEASIVKLEEALNSNNERLSQEVTKLNENLQKNEIEIVSLNEKLVEETSGLNETIKNNAGMFAKLEETLNNNINLIKKETKENTNKLEEKTKEKQTKTDEKIKVIKDSLKNLQNETKTIEENLKKELEQLSQQTSVTNIKIDEHIQENNKSLIEQIEKINADLQASNLLINNIEEKMTANYEQIKNDVISEEQKIRTEIDEQIKNNKNKNKLEFKNIEKVIEDIQNTINQSTQNVGQEILKLQEETKLAQEKQEANKSNLVLLKNDYNKYVLKVNDALNKISKSVLDVQKKNVETNKNLQIKIKKYIDSKLESSNNTKYVEDLINSLSLSMLEKEKLQKIEMEQLLNKKLKQIEKENERILNKKIEEINNLLRNQVTYNNSSINNVNDYKDLPKKKKNMYELIDSNQILKRSATTNNSLTTKQGKSQILKFYYDEDEDLN